MRNAVSCLVAVTASLLLCPDALASKSKRLAFTGRWNGNEFIGIRLEGIDGTKTLLICQLNASPGTAGQCRDAFILACNGKDGLTVVADGVNGARVTHPTDWIVPDSDRNGACPQNSGGIRRRALFDVSGVATGGGTVSLNLQGTVVSVPTVASQTPEETISGLNAELFAVDPLGDYSAFDDSGAGLTMLAVEELSGVDFTMVALPGISASSTDATQMIQLLPVDSCLDCNGNGVFDDVDIALGTELDLDGDGVPDSCSPPPPVVAVPVLSIGWHLFFTVGVLALAMAKLGPQARRRRGDG